MRYYDEKQAAYQAYGPQKTDLGEIGGMRGKNSLSVSCEKSFKSPIPGACQLVGVDLHNDDLTVFIFRDKLWQNNKV